MNAGPGTDDAQPDASSSGPRTGRGRTSAMTKRSWPIISALSLALILGQVALMAVPAYRQPDSCPRPLGGQIIRPLLDAALGPTVPRHGRG